MQTEARTYDLYNKEGKYIKTELLPPETELSNPEPTAAKTPDKSCSP